MLFVIPSYNFLDESDVLPLNNPSYGYRKAQIRPYSDYVAKYLQWAQDPNVSVNFRDRPKQFFVSGFRMSRPARQFIASYRQK